MTKSIGTLLCAATILAVFPASITLHSHPAEARSILDILFGDKNKDAPKGPPPEVTLQAPFPTTPDRNTTGNNSALMQMYNTPSTDQNGTSLDQPHRSPQQISDWAAGIASQAMTISPDTWTADFGKLAVNFTPYAAEEYKAYVQKSNFISILTGNHMRLQAIADDAAMVTREGAIAGTYHWLVQIPLMTSFYKSDMTEVDKNATTQSQKLIVQVQVGRVAPKNNADIGLVIERWQVSGGGA